MLGSFQQRAKKHGLGESLFSRLTSCSENWPSGSPVVLLNQQYRMHPDIAEYPNRAFYGGLIRSVPPARPRVGLPPYSIISISSGDKGQGMLSYYITQTTTRTLTRLTVNGTVY